LSPMSFLDDVFKSVTANPALNVSENPEICKADIFGVNIDSIPSERRLLLEKRLVEAVDAGMEVNLIFEVEYSEPIYVSGSSVDDINKKLDELEDVAGDGGKVKVELRVVKPEGGPLNIFSISAFSSYLSGLGLEGRFSLWSRYISSGLGNVKVWSDVSPFETRSLSFSSVAHDISITPGDELERHKAIDNRNKCGHFANSSQFDFLPEDFLILKGKAPESLSKHFYELSIFSLVIFLSDFSLVEESSLSYNLKGYKTVSGVVGLSDVLGANGDELREIYEWVYLGGNFSDKIGIARNVMSIHLESESILSIEKGTSRSIRSGYDLYLKENVKQYIDIKNKISEFMQSQSDKASEITKNMFSMFKTGIWSFATFLISVFLLRVIARSNESNAFTLEVVQVSVFLFVFSCVYLFVSLMEVNSDRNRLLEKYRAIRGRYEDLLDPKDLDKIIDTGKVISREKSFVDKKRNRYAFFWMLVNVAFLCFVISMYFEWAWFWFLLEYGSSRFGSE